MQVKVHPAANLFPLMDEEQYQALKADMAIRGQQHGVIFWKNELVDGRNRLKACEELNLELNSFELDEDDDPVAYVISANLHRRHLTTAQRGMVAAKLATLKRGDVKTQKESGGPNGLPTFDAAKLLQVSEKTVKRAKQVIEHGSKELLQAVERGEVNLNQAVNLVEQVESKTEQAKIVAQGKEAIKAASVPVVAKPKAKPKQEAKPIEGASDDEPDDYDYAIVKAFEHCDCRLSTLRRIVEMLAPHEKTVVMDWLTD